MLYTACVSALELLSRFLCTQVLLPRLPAWISGFSFPDYRSHKSATHPSAPNEEALSSQDSVTGFAPPPPPLSQQIIYQMSTVLYSLTHSIHNHYGQGVLLMRTRKPRLKEVMWPTQGSLG